MYNFVGPSQTGWTALWHDTAKALRAQGIDAPATLTTSTDPWQDWTAPDLLLSQTCGLPFRAKLHDHLTLVGSPVWGGPNKIAPGRYFSVVVARTDDTRRELHKFSDATLAYNDPLSQSGWGLMMQLCAMQNIKPGKGLETGSHQASAYAVAQGHADFAAIDVVTWYHLQAHFPWAAALRVIAHTPDSPALPFVTAHADLAEALFDALSQALATLTLRSTPIERAFFAPPGIVAAKLADYMAIPLPPTPAQVWGD